MNIEFLNTYYTEDNLMLPMVHFASKKKKICVIFIHGMCGNIIDNHFASTWGKLFTLNEIGFLYEHNRGHSLMNDLLRKDGSFLRCGCMYEVFEDSIFDIDLAISCAKDLGYKQIILMGHSFGCNKVIHYYYHRHPEVKGIILASAPDMVGFHNLFEPSKENLLKEAEKRIEEGKGETLLSKEIEGYMFMSANAYYNWYNKQTNLNNIPISENKENWQEWQSIDVPIFTFSGEKEEELYHHLDLLKEKAKSCPDFTYKYIKGATHTYQNKEEEIGSVIIDWIKERI